MDDISKNEINFGHGAAINGAFSVDSHNTTIQQAQKSSGELDMEKRKLYKQQCEIMLKDGRINTLEAKTLESFRLSIGLDKDIATRILNEVKNLSSINQDSTLGPIQRMTLNQVVSLAKAEKIIMLQGSLPRLEAILSRTPDAEVSFYFNMLSMAIQPDYLIAKYENRVCDDYWQTYWAYMSYFNLGDSRKAEMAFSDLDKWQEYPFGNVALLASVNLLYQYRLDSSLGEFKEQAEDFLNQGPEDHSTLLEPLANILSAIIVENHEALAQLETEHPFYFHYILQKLLRTQQKNVEPIQKNNEIIEPRQVEEEAPADDSNNRNTEEFIPEPTEPEQVTDESRCSVRLLKCGTDSAEVVDAICEFGAMDKKEVELLVSRVPCIVLEDIDKDDAEELTMLLDAANAQYEIVSAKEKIDLIALRRPKHLPEKIEFGGIFSNRLEQLMATVLEDGVLTAKGKQMVIKRAQKEDEDVDEVLMVLESKMNELGIVDDSGE